MTELDRPTETATVNIKVNERAKNKKPKRMCALRLHSTGEEMTINADDGDRGDWRGASIENSLNDVHMRVSILISC